MAIRNDISVDWTQSPRIITVASPSTSITIQDLNDTLRNIETESWEGMQFPTLLSTAGKNNLGGGAQVGITLTLQNAQLSFQARSGPTYTQCTVSGGNLVAVDDLNASISPIYPTAFTQIVIAQSASPTIYAPDLTTITSNTEELLGLSMKNVVLTSTSFDLNGNMLTGTLVVYATKADADAENASAIVARYPITATYDGLGRNTKSKQTTAS